MTTNTSENSRSYGMWLALLGLVVIGGSVAGWFAVRSLWNQGAEAASAEAVERFYVGVAALDVEANERAVAAFQVLSQSLPDEPAVWANLAIARLRLNESQPAVEAQVASAGLGGSVRFLGYVGRAELPALYRQAACVVFPSLFEGFGMPVLEAMASGCPVVCSNTTSLPEIAGDAAELVDPRDPDAIAAAIVRLLSDRELRAERVRRGRARAATYSWRRHTLETLAVLRMVHQDLRRI